MGAMVAGVASEHELEEEKADRCREKGTSTAKGGPCHAHAGGYPAREHEPEVAGDHRTPQPRGDRDSPASRAGAAREGGGVMAVMHRNIREETRVRSESERTKREARQNAEAERAAAADAQLEREVEAEMLAEREARETEAALPEPERTERRLRRMELENTSGVQAVLVKHPARPRGWACAREKVAARWRAETEAEREQRERADGTFKRRQEWERVQAAIAAKRDTDLRAERERHDKAIEAINQAAESALEKLGARP